MIAILRQALLLGLAALLSWWFMLVELEGPGSSQDAEPATRPVSVVPQLAPPTSPVTEPVAAEPLATPVDEERQEDVALETSPPPPELGLADGEIDGEALAEEGSEEAPEDPEQQVTSTQEEALAQEDASTQEDALAQGEALAQESALAEAEQPAEESVPEAPSIEQLAQDSSLLAEARQELEGDIRRGFTTVLLASPEDQLELARAFGEELVLVPKSAIDPNSTNPSYFRLRTTGPPRVETVHGRPELSKYRQYRDLFDYEYARLPEALRTLRRSVLSRDEVFLFAALIPVSEWAVVVGRRREALASAERAVEDVDRFVLRYVRDKHNRFDLKVENITYAN